MGHATQRGDAVSVQQMSLEGEQVLAYTYRYWSPLIVRVPLPGGSEPSVRELETPTNVEAPWKLAMVPSNQGNTLGLLVSFETDARHGLWQLRWYPHQDAEGREVLSGPKLANRSLEPVPPFAIRSRDGIHLAGGDPPDSKWQLQLDASAQPVGGLEPVASINSIPDRFRDVGAELGFEKSKVVLRRNAWGVGPLEHVVVAQDNWHRSGQDAATAEWLGESFAVAVAKYDKPAWRFM